MKDWVARHAVDGGCDSALDAEEEEELESDMEYEGFDE